MICKVCTARCMTASVGELHIWLQLHSKFPWICTVRRDVKWHTVCKVMYLWYMHMKHQKVPLYVFLGPGVPVLLHRTKGAGPRLLRLHRFSSGMRFDQHLSSSSNPADRNSLGTKLQSFSGNMSDSSSIIPRHLPPSVFDYFHLQILSIWCSVR